MQFWRAWLLKTHMFRANLPVVMGQESEPPPQVSGHALIANGRAVSLHEDGSVFKSAFKWLRHKLSGKNESSLKEMLEDVLDEEAHEALFISEEEKTILKNIAEFGELTVGDIMVPRTEIMGVDKTVSATELARHIAEIGHTRIPVYEGSLDKIEGFLHVKDLFIAASQKKTLDVTKLMRAILFVPPSMRIVDLLLKMRVSGCHMAIVVDEYGGTDGLVTMEDLIEELVGEIQDEHDQDDDEVLMQWVNAQSLEADAKTEIDDLEEALGARLTEGDVNALDFDTIGGLIFSRLGRVPVRGEVLEINGHKIEILLADPRRIHRVRITRYAQNH